MRQVLVFAAALGLMGCGGCDETPEVQPPPETGLEEAAAARPDGALSLCISGGDDFLERLHRFGGGLSGAAIDWIPTKLSEAALQWLELPEDLRGRASGPLCGLVVGEERTVAFGLRGGAIDRIGQRALSPAEVPGMFWVEGADALFLPTNEGPILLAGTDRATLAETASYLVFSLLREERGEGLFLQMDGQLVASFGEDIAEASAQQFAMLQGSLDDESGRHRTEAPLGNPQGLLEAFQRWAQPMFTQYPAEIASLEAAMEIKDGRLRIQAALHPKASTELARLQGELQALSGTPLAEVAQELNADVAFGMYRQDPNRWPFADVLRHGGRYTDAELEQLGALPGAVWAATEVGARGVALAAEFGAGEAPDVEALQALSTAAYSQTLAEALFECRFEEGACGDFRWQASGRGVRLWAAELDDEGVPYPFRPRGTFAQPELGNAVAGFYLNPRRMAPLALHLAGRRAAEAAQRAENDTGDAALWMLLRAEADALILEALLGPASFAELAASGAM